jgi:hypothetical protein
VTGASIQLAARNAGPRSALRPLQREECVALAPARIRSSPKGPYDTSANDCVATAPTAASPQGTTRPTENQSLCTATPSSPVRGSLATME